MRRVWASRNSGKRWQAPGKRKLEFLLGTLTVRRSEEESLGATEKKIARGFSPSTSSDSLDPRRDVGLTSKSLFRLNCNVDSSLLLTFRTPHFQSPFHSTCILSKHESDCGHTGCAEGLQIPGKRWQAPGSVFLRGSGRPREVSF